MYKPPKFRHTFLNVASISTSISREQINAIQNVECIIHSTNRIEWLVRVKNCPWCWDSTNEQGRDQPLRHVHTNEEQRQVKRQLWHNVRIAMIYRRLRVSLRKKWIKLSWGVRKTLWRKWCLSSELRDQTQLIRQRLGERLFQAKI